MVKLLGSSLLYNNFIFWSPWGVPITLLFLDYSDLIFFLIFSISHFIYTRLFSFAWESLRPDIVWGIWDDGLMDLREYKFPYQFFIYFIRLSYCWGSFVGWACFNTFSTEMYTFITPFSLAPILLSLKFGNILWESK